MQMLSSLLKRVSGVE